MKRVVYLIEQPFDERNFERFGIQAWIDRQWDVEVWDLTPWAHPRVWEDFNRRGHGLKQFAGYIPIAGGRALQASLGSAATIRCFVDLTGAGFHSVRAKAALKRAGAKQDRLRRRLDPGSRARHAIDLEIGKGRLQGARRCAQAAEFGLFFASDSPAHPG